VKDEKGLACSGVLFESIPYILSKSLLAKSTISNNLRRGLSTKLVLMETKLPKTLSCKTMIYPLGTKKGKVVRLCARLSLDMARGRELFLKLEFFLFTVISFHFRTNKIAVNKGTSRPHSLETVVTVLFYTQCFHTGQLTADSLFVTF